jgi:acetyl coenzyme A synthetase (ADP forming)-like protein
VIGHAVWLPSRGDAAEFGIAVADAFQGNGLGTLLLGQIADAAERAGIRSLEGLVDPGNPRMLRVLRDLGFPVTFRRESGVLRVTFPASLRHHALEPFDRREAEAARSAVRNFLCPRGIAVVGASRRADSIGSALFRNLLAGGFLGPVYPVNREARVVHSVVAYPTVLDCPDPLDLVVVAVPAAAVPGVARDCAKRGVRALVVISAGFAESGEAGVRLQAELVEVCREGGMRLIGPNGMGIANTDPGVRMNAQFSAAAPRPGRIGLLSQSGALGIAIIDEANRLGLGLSAFVSAGNKADVSGNDLLQYWEEDPRTDLVLLYLESFGNPRKFVRIARRVARKKPIVAVKSGRSAAGFRATQSHTGALVRASDLTADALFRQSGVVRTDTLGEMFDVAAFLASQPVPRGDRVAILSNGGGLGILAADACEDEGLQVPELPPATQRALRESLPAGAGVRNPVDLLATATAADYGRAIRTLRADAGIDSLIVLFVPPVAVRPEEVAAELVSAVRERGGVLPTASVFLACRGFPEALSSEGFRIPSYPSPENAARALGKAAAYGRWLRAPEGTPPVFADLRRDEAAARVSRGLEARGGWLSPEDARSLLEAYGIPLVPTRIVEGPAHAARAAEEFGGTVALKGIAPSLVHKTEAGAVRLGLDGAPAVERAAREMEARLAAAGHHLEGFLVQPMVEEGVEMLVGVTHDPNFGPVVVCAAGGVLVELFQDVAGRLTPLSTEDVREMIRSLKTYPLLEGYRGGPRHDRAALEELILRVGALVEDHPPIVELDLNPVKVLPEGRGVSVLDARVRVAKGLPVPPLGSRGAC